MARTMQTSRKVKPIPTKKRSTSSPSPKADIIKTRSKTKAEPAPSTSTSTRRRRKVGTALERKGRKGATGGEEEGRPRGSARSHRWTYLERTLHAFNFLHSDNPRSSVNIRHIIAEVENQGVDQEIELPKANFFVKKAMHLLAKKDFVGRVYGTTNYSLTDTGKALISSTRREIGLSTSTKKLNDLEEEKLWLAVSHDISGTLGADNLEKKSARKESADVKKLKKELEQLRAEKDAWEEEKVQMIEELERAAEDGKRDELAMSVFVPLSSFLEGSSLILSALLFILQGLLPRRRRQLRRRLRLQPARPNRLQLPSACSRRRRSPAGRRTTSPFSSTVLAL
ncbi:hypothetical protein BDY24DRAFT_233869 [Mrakia frigida]|uniref:uncharacterized protein n=1 Tax=Mrakia frigida TaxID=29902 RepID=UPI003FCC0FEA